MTCVEVTIREELDGIQTRIVIKSTEDYTPNEAALANAIAGLAKTGLGSAARIARHELKRQAKNGEDNHLVSPLGSGRPSVAETPHARGSAGTDNAESTHDGGTDRSTLENNHD